MENCYYCENPLPKKGHCSCPDVQHELHDEMSCLDLEDQLDFLMDEKPDLRGLYEQMEIDATFHDSDGTTDMGFDAAGLASAGHGMDEDY